MPTVCCITRDYRPGSTTVMTPPTLVARSTIVLTWPYVSPTLTLTIRNPEFRNTHRSVRKRIYRTTRGGTIKAYRNTTWPVTEELQYEFKGLSEASKVALVTFLKSSLGQEIGLLDFETRQWRGIIVQPDSEISQQFELCGYGFTLNFDGSLS